MFGTRRSFIWQKGNIITGAALMLGSNPSGVGISFLDNSMCVRDPVTFANNYSGLPFSKLSGATRASSGSFIGSNGLLQTVGNNVPRFEYNPITLAPLGVLFEPAATNISLQSEAADAAVWIKEYVTVAANTAVAPDGNLTADLVIPDTSNTGTHRLYQTITTSASQYTWSRFVKAGGYNFFVMQLSSLAGYVEFNLSNGTYLISGVNYTATIKAYPNGWYRVSTTFTATAAANIFLEYVYSVTGALAYAGNGTSGIYVFGDQLKLGGVATSYIATTSAQVTRAADNPATLASTLFNLSSTAATIFAEVDWNGGTASDGMARGAAGIDQGALNNSFSLYNYGGNQGYSEYSGGVFQYVLNSGTQVISDVATKSAFSANASASGFSADGAAAITFAASSFPVGLNALTIGTSQGNAQINGHIRRMMYLPNTTNAANLAVMSGTL